MINKTKVISFFCNTTVKTIFVGLPVPLFLAAIGITPALGPAITGSIASIAIKEGCNCFIPDSIVAQPLRIGHAVGGYFKYYIQGRNPVIGVLNEVSHYYSKQHIRTHPETLLLNYLVIEISDSFLTQATKNLDPPLNIIGAIIIGTPTGLVKAIFTETLLSKYGTPLIESCKNFLITYEYPDLTSFFFEELPQPQRQHLL